MGGVVKMTRFYDVRSDAELAKVEDVLALGGVEYAIGNGPGGNEIKEILVAEEDLPKAEELLYLSSKRIFCSLHPR